jgi:hypothetical protein
MKIIALIQMATMVALAIGFWQDGDKRLAIAQIMYLVATGALFLR